MSDKSFDFGTFNTFGIQSTSTLDATDLDNFLSDEPEVVPAGTSSTTVASTTKPPSTTTIQKTTVNKPLLAAPEEKQQLEQEDVDNFLGEEENDGADATVVDEVPEGVGQKETNADVNLYEVFSEDLFNLGRFTKNEGETDVKISTPEDFVARFDGEVYKHAESYISQFLSRFGKDKVDFFESVFVSGIEPEDYFQRYNAIQNIADINIKEEHNQERIMREFFRQEGRDDEYITKRIQRLKDYSDLEEEATGAKEILLKKEQDALAAEVEKKNAAQQRKQEQKRQYDANVAKILREKIVATDFDGIPVDDGFAKEVNKYLTAENWEIEGGPRMTEFDKELLELQRPENTETKVKLAMLLKLLKTDKTLSKLKRKAASEEKKDLFKKVQSIAGSKTTAKNKNKEESSAVWQWK
jgi:hypothetical protein